MILHFLESLEIRKYKQDNIILSITAIPEFVTQVNVALEALNKNSLDVFDDNQFVDISKKIYDTIHDIRCSVMMIRVSLLYLSLNYLSQHLLPAGMPRMLTRNVLFLCHNVNAEIH